MARYRLHESELLLVDSTGMPPVEEVKPRAYSDGRLKLSPTGVPTYSCNVQKMRDSGYGTEQGVSVAVCEYVAYPKGTELRADGAVWVTPYEANGRVAYSFIVERLVPVNTSPNREKREG